MRTRSLVSGQRGEDVTGFVRRRLFLQIPELSGSEAVLLLNNRRAQGALQRAPNPNPNEEEKFQR